MSGFRDLMARIDSLQAYDEPTVEEYTPTEPTVHPLLQAMQELKEDGVIDEYFAHRQCEHVWGDLDGDGEEECLKCGKIKDEAAEINMEG